MYFLKLAFIYLLSLTLHYAFWKSSLSFMNYILYSFGFVLTLLSNVHYTVNKIVPPKCTLH